MRIAASLCGRSAVLCAMPHPSRPEAHKGGVPLPDPQAPQRAGVETKAAAALLGGLLLLLGCGGSTMAPPVPTPSPAPSPTPDPDTQVVPTEATGPVRIVFAGA